jgi:hypothetical protein
MTDLASIWFARATMLKVGEISSEKKLSNSCPRSTIIYFECCLKYLSPGYFAVGVQYLLTKASVFHRLQKTIMELAAIQFYGTRNGTNKRWRQMTLI